MPGDNPLAYIKYICNMQLVFVFYSTSLILLCLLLMLYSILVYNKNKAYTLRAFAKTFFLLRFKVELEPGLDRRRFVRPFTSWLSKAAKINRSRKSFSVLQGE